MRKPPPKKPRSKELSELSKMIKAHAALIEQLPPPPDSRTLEPDRNSMLFWFPRIEAAGLPVPRTTMVRFDNRTMWPAMDGLEIPDVPWNDFTQAAEQIGFPCFLRADQSSAKHGGPSAYRLDDGTQIRNQILNTFEDNCLKDLPVLAFAFREWLDIEASFSAFGWRDHPGHPIGREWRLFADSKHVRCGHFYWPKDAIDGHRPSEPDWKERLAVLAKSLPEREQVQLGDLALTAVNALGESPDSTWSVDFAKDTSGKWWLIDMAVAERSWHPECPHR